MRAPDPTVREGLVYVLLAILALFVIAGHSSPLPGERVAEVASR